MSSLSLIIGSATAMLKNDKDFIGIVNDPPTPRYQNAVSIHNYQFNNPEATVPEYGVSFNFNIAFYNYNYFCLAMENIEEHITPKNIHFGDFFIGKLAYDTPSN